jgi:hypothetical protein
MKEGAGTRRALKSDFQLLEVLGQLFLGLVKVSGCEQRTVERHRPLDSASTPRSAELSAPLWSAQARVGALRICGIGKPWCLRACGGWRGGIVKWGFRGTQLVPGSSYRSGDDMQCYWSSVQHNKARGVCCAVMSKEGLVSWVPGRLYPALARSRPSLIGRHILAHHSPKLWFTLSATTSFQSIQRLA